MKSNNKITNSEDKYKKKGKSFKKIGYRVYNTGNLSNKKFLESFFFENNQDKEIDYKIAILNKELASKF